MKNIKVGEYWTVKYRNYTGSVLVKEIRVPYKDTVLEGETEYYCIISKSSDETNKRNRRYWCIFHKKDFRHKVTEQEFLRARMKYLLAITKKINKKLGKIGL